MANFIPNNTRDTFLGTGTRIDLDADTIKAMFVDQADDTPVVGDDFIDDILSAGRVPALGSCPSLSGKIIGSGGQGVGIFDASDTVFTTLTGDPSEWLLIFKDTGVESTSNIIACWDTATGLPLTPNGADVTVVWGVGIVSV